jgi:hypothetical protein
MGQNRRVTCRSYIDARQITDKSGTVFGDQHVGNGDWWTGVQTKLILVLIDSGSHRVFVFHTYSLWNPDRYLGSDRPKRLETGSKSGHGQHNHVSVYSPSLTPPQFQKANRSRIRHVVLRAPFECFVADTFLLRTAFVASGTLLESKLGFAVAYFGLCVVGEAQRSPRPDILPIIELRP